MPSLFILVPLIGIMILNLPFRKIMRRAAFWFAAVIFSAQILFSIFHHIFFYGNVLERFGSFFAISFYVDSLTVIMLLCIGIVCLASLIVAEYMITDKVQLFRLINILIISCVGMNGIVMVKDIFSLYVFLEVTAISSFILIAFNKDISGLEGAFKYIILSSVATMLMLTSIGLLFLLSGDISFSGIHEALVSTGGNWIFPAALGIYICGLFIKGGLVPFHGWLPDAYSKAPSAVSILLAGIVTKACGIYTIIRIMTAVFGLNAAACNIMMFIGTFSILVGAFAALGQTDFKRMLAYSSISQVGYIILGLGVGTELGIIGAVFHLFNHSMFKSLLFVNSAAVEAQTGTTDMDKMGGLSAKMPVTGATSLVGFLSVSGVPPLSGFWSKIIIVLALWQTNNYFYAVIAVLASVLTLAYLLSMQRKVFFGQLNKGLIKIKEAGSGVQFISVTLALITVCVGIFFPFVFNSLIQPAKEILLK